MHGEIERLSKQARQLLVDPGNTLHLSAASAWEIGIKVAKGKLELPEAPERYITRRLAEHRVQALPMNHHHALRAAGLPPHHRDPFDRMLVAQAQIENMPLMTADAWIPRYEVEVLPAATPGR